MGHVRGFAGGDPINTRGVAVDLADDAACPLS
jgi:hypothetical protein